MLDLNIQKPALTDKKIIQSIWDPASVMGTLYVLEGSALGARVLSGKLRTIGMTADNGARHIAVQTGNPEAWKCFLSVLENFPMTSDEEDRCVIAAKAAFNVFEFQYKKASSHE